MKKRLDWSVTEPLEQERKVQKMMMENDLAKVKGHRGYRSSPRTSANSPCPRWT